MADPKFVSINVTTPGPATLVSGVAGKKLRVVSYVVTPSVAMVIEFRSGASTVKGSVDLAANTPVPFPGKVNAPAFESDAGDYLAIAGSAAGTIRGHLAYIEVDE